MKVIDFRARKDEQQKISMVTCYDFWSAQIVETSGIDCILVGDSAAMIMHGHSNTIPELARMLCECEIAVMDESEYDRLIMITVEDAQIHVETLNQDELFKQAPKC